MRLQAFINAGHVGCTIKTLPSLPNTELQRDSPVRLSIGRNTRH
uniref:Uncharacterized protein n=1 Tax=Anguilla anguilla TaxID=7936 RepID=A0A0E9T9C3_ANGAN